MNSRCMVDGFGFGGAHRQMGVIVVVVVVGGNAFGGKCKCKIDADACVTVAEVMRTSCFTVGAVQSTGMILWGK